MFDILLVLQGGDAKNDSSFRIKLPMVKCFNGKENIGLSEDNVKELN